MSALRGLTDGQTAIGSRMLDDGATWTDIARALNTTIHAVQMVLKPGYRERRRQLERASYSTRTYKPKRPDGSILGHHTGPRPVSPDEARRVIALVPPDTRGLTARLFGDPLPGRSALERQSGHP